MCEAVPYPGTELYDYAKSLGLELAKDWSLYHEETQVFKNTLLPLEKLNETKKDFYDHYLSPTYYLRKKLKRRLLQPNHGTKRLKPHCSK